MSGSVSAENAPCMLLQIQLYPPDFDICEHCMTETHVCPCSPGAGELSLKVQGSKAKPTGICHKGDLIMFAYLLKNVLQADMLCGGTK